MNYKTAEHIQSEKRFKRSNTFKFIHVCLAWSVAAVFLFVLIKYSIETESQIKALKAQIQACEAKPPCKRELNK